MFARENGGREKESSKERQSAFNLLFIFSTKREIEASGVCVFFSFYLRASKPVETCIVVYLLEKEIVEVSCVLSWIRRYIESMVHV